MDQKTELLTIFGKLNREDQQTAFDLVTLYVFVPEFFEAMEAATPAGEVAPPWNVTKRLVAEWIAEYAGLKHQLYPDGEMC